MTLGTNGLNKKLSWWYDHNSLVNFQKYFHRSWEQDLKNMNTRPFYSVEMLFYKHIYNINIFCHAAARTVKNWYGMWSVMCTELTKGSTEFIVQLHSLSRSKIAAISNFQLKKKLFVKHLENQKSFFLSIQKKLP